MNHDEAAAYEPVNVCDEALRVEVTAALATTGAAKGGGEETRGGGDLPAMKTLYQVDHLGIAFGVLGCFLHFGSAASAASIRISIRTHVRLVGAAL